MFQPTDRPHTRHHKCATDTLLIDNDYYLLCRAAAVYAYMGARCGVSKGESAVFLGRRRSVVSVYLLFYRSDFCQTRAIKREMYCKISSGYHHHSKARGQTRLLVGSKNTRKRHKTGSFAWNYNIYMVIVCAFYSQHYPYDACA